jgi:hydrogenase expression/formation protein HypD
MTAYLLKHGMMVFSSHKLMPPAMQMLTKDMRIDGFILPGHVATITGSKMWENLDLGIPQVISGFEPEMVMEAVYFILKNIAENNNSVLNCYREVVSSRGNKTAQDMISSTMKHSDSEWRGMGIIPDSGLVPVNEELDARICHEDVIRNVKSMEHPGCICGKVIRGLAEPEECLLFGKACTPEHPVGACMVSQDEGSCAISYTYKRGLSE